MKSDLHKFAYLVQMKLDEYVVLKTLHVSGLLEWN